MPSSLIDSNYYRDMFGTAAMRQVFSDENRIQTWLDTEVALAIAEEKAGVIPAGTAKEIKDAAKVSNLDLEAMKQEFDRVGFPILPFVHQLVKACSRESSCWVHYGATTQDILDTGMVLQMRDGLKLVEDDLTAIIKALKKLIVEHRTTVMAGRTFHRAEHVDAAAIARGYRPVADAPRLLHLLDRHRVRVGDDRQGPRRGNLGPARPALRILGSR